MALSHIRRLTLSSQVNCKNSLSSNETKKPIGRRERRILEARENLFRNALQLFAVRGFCLRYPVEVTNQKPTQAATGKHYDSICI